MEKDAKEEKLLPLLSGIVTSSGEIISNFSELIRLKLRVVSKSVEIILWLVGFIILLAISSWILLCFSVVTFITSLGFSLQFGLVLMLLVHLILIGFCGVMIAIYKSNINFKLMNSEISDSTRRHLYDA